MARPRKDPSQRKSVDIRVPMTEEQKRLVVQAAASAHSDVATWARPILLRAASKLDLSSPFALVDGVLYTAKRRPRVDRIRR